MRNEFRVKTAGVLAIAGVMSLLSSLPAVADLVMPIASVTEHVNIRMEADPKSEIVGRLRAGEGLPFKRTVPGWHEVTLADGAYGFVSEDWSEVLTDDEYAKRVAAQSAAEVANEAAAIADNDETADEVDIAVTTGAAVEEEATSVADTSESADESAKELPAVMEDAAEMTEAVTAEIAEEATATDSVSETAVEKSAADVAAVTEATADSAEAVVDSEIQAAEPESEPAPEAAPAVATEPETEATPELPAATAPSPSLEIAEATTIVVTGPPGPAGPAGADGLPGAATIRGTVDRLVKFTESEQGGNSQIFDNGRNVGIGTDQPEQRLEVNGNIKINEQNSNVAGLIISQASGDTGYIMHNRANTLTIGAGSVDRMTIDRDGNLGIGVARPSRPLEMASGAYVSEGGVWTNSSSRERKENIVALDDGDALAALSALEPVRFTYKRDNVEEYVGFIAEDVPDLVASTDRQSLSTMDIVAVLTKVVQQQQRKIEELEARINANTTN